MKEEIDVDRFIEAFEELTPEGMRELVDMEEFKEAIREVALIGVKFYLINGIPVMDYMSTLEEISKLESWLK